MNINKYKLSSWVLSLIAGTVVFLLCFQARVKADNPNGIDNKSEPGWSLWLEKYKAKYADFEGASQF
ncbi:MAG: hypothetical protein KI793_19505 [Rivularia sp. (in: Bacteria)]|nr:hypothetical protein [Rivularia sp. MS3]